MPTVTPTNCSTHARENLAALTGKALEFEIANTQEACQGPAIRDIGTKRKSWFYDEPFAPKKTKHVSATQRLRTL